MGKKLLRIGSLCIALVIFMSSLSGCGTSKDQKDSDTAATGTPGASASQNYWELLDSVDDTSDLPDWTGKQLKLVEWYGHGSGSADQPKSTNDVVTPEVKRVTGVELDADDSFDNGGNSIDVKMGLLAASQDWPDIIYTSNTDLIKSLVTSGELYDLTELLPEYCPNIMKLFDTTKFPKIMQNITANASDRIYFVPVQAERTYYAEANKDNPDFNKERWSRIQPPSPMSDWTRLWVRDDILTKMYPDAKTQDEIEELYMSNGGFTKEEIFDVPINSAEEFLKFLTDMKTLIDQEGIKENGKPVEVTYANNGGDNWPLMACLIPQIYGIPGADYFSYYDKLTGKLVRTVDQSWFKDSVHEFQRLVSAGVISKESLLDNSATFTEKLNSGHYAISYAWLKPDETALKEAGKDYRYRLLWPDVEYNYEQFSSIMGENGNSLNIGIFKDTVKEEDLPQILRYLDYMVSDIGSKLTFWGPRSAGLFTEENGTRVYTDPELEANMVYGADNQRNIYYNLLNKLGSGTSQQAWPMYPISADANIYHPKYMYDNIELNKSNADTYFQPGMLDGYSKEEHHVYATQGQSITNFSEQWNVFGKGRDAFEKALTRPLAARDDQQFEELWQELLKETDAAGMNEQTIEEMNTIFFEKNPTIKEDTEKVSK